MNKGTAYLKKIKYPEFTKSAPVVDSSVDETESRIKERPPDMYKLVLTRFVFCRNSEFFANLVYLIYFSPRFEEMLPIIRMTGTHPILVGNESVEHPKLVSEGKADLILGKPNNIVEKVLYLSADSITHANREAAVLRINGIKFVILKARCSFIQVSDFSEVGLRSLSYNIILVKSKHQYSELQNIAPIHLMEVTLGFYRLNITILKFNA